MYNAGNYVSSGNGFYKIYAVSIDEVLAIQDYKEGPNRQYKIYPAENTILSPIQINLDWLKDLGFEMSEKEPYTYYKLVGKYKLKVIMDGRRVMIVTLSEILSPYGIRMFGIQYVHELQNMCYSNTKETLSI